MRLLLIFRRNPNVLIGWEVYILNSLSLRICLDHSFWNGQWNGVNLKLSSRPILVIYFASSLRLKANQKTTWPQQSLTCYRKLVIQGHLTSSRYQFMPSSNFSGRIISFFPICVMWNNDVITNGLFTLILRLLSSLCVTKFIFIHSRI